MRLTIVTRAALNKIKIGLDARFALGERRGIGNFSLDLFRAMAVLPHPFELVFYSDREDTEGLLSQFPNSRVRVIRPGIYPIWEQVRLPLALLQDRIQVFHAVGNTGPILLSGSIKRVLTIHDVMFLKPESELPRSPSLYQRMGRIYRRIVAPRAGRRADLTFTDSEFSRQDILASIPGLDPLKVKIAYVGLPRHFLVSPPSIGTHPLQGQDYLLHLGALDPRKNTALVVKTFLALRRQKAIKEHLVILGLKSLDALGLTPMESQEVKESIHFPGYVPESAMPAFYRHARAFLFPSLYEGFGIPLIEAMACGTPIIASNTTSLPEIAGNAARLINPKSGDQLKGAILELLGSPVLQMELIARGKERTREFCWDNTARKTLDAYSQLISQGESLNFIH